MRIVSMLAVFLLASLGCFGGGDAPLPLAATEGLRRMCTPVP